MSKQVQLRRGTATEHSSFIGAAGEITVDTTNNTIRVHDGHTSGGISLAKKSEIPDLTTIDYVIDYQIPTSVNNYTWYRKYKSGWVEQGGLGTPSAASTYKAEFPIEMQNTQYTLVAISKSPSATSSTTPHGCHYTTKNTTDCSIITLKGNSGDWISAEVNWYICGFAAE